MSTNALSENHNKATIRMLFVAGVLIFTYTALKAYLISITWDESQSYREYIKNNIVLFGKYDSISANNHLLNTIGGIFFTTIFGVNEFTLRITSLIAHLFFLYYSARLVSRFENKWIALSGFLILNLNPYMLDFFSLARGYSTSMGFMMASIYYLYLFIKNNYKTKDAIVSILYAELATLGNLTLLNYCLVLYGVISMLLILNNKNIIKPFSLSLKKTIIQLVLPTLLFAIFLCFILPVSFKLKEAGALFMGGDNGLWQDTVGSIIPRLWYRQDVSFLLQSLTKTIFLLILFSGTLYFAIKYMQKKMTGHHTFPGVLLLIFYLIILSTVTQHYLLGTLYLIERSVLFLYVLLMLIVVFFMNELCFESKKYQYILHIFAILVTIHFVLSANLKWVYEWKEDCETKIMLSDLEKIRQPTIGKFNLRISVPLLLESSIDYYRIVNNLSWLNQAKRSKNVDYADDYFFLTPGDFKNENKDSIEIIKTYPVTKNILAKPKYPFHMTAISFDSVITFKNDTEFKMDRDMEFGPGYEYVFNDSTTPILNTVISCKVEFETKQKFTGNVYLITSYEDKNGLYEWISWRLNDFCMKPVQSATACVTTDVPKTVKAGDKLKVFVWNQSKQELFLKAMHLRMIHYSN